VSALHLHIDGRVQGVGFRESLRQEAERLRITGWIRNCADGSVEAVIAGDEAAVAAMLNWCHAGPPQARVEKVEHATTMGSFNSSPQDRMTSAV